MLTTEKESAMPDAATQAVIKAALNLPEESRLQVVVELVESLDADDVVSPDEHRRLWTDEIRQRIADYDAGLEETIPYDVIRAEVRARYGR